MKFLVSYQHEFSIHIDIVYPSTTICNLGLLCNSKPHINQLDKSCFSISVSPVYNLH